MVVGLIADSSGVTFDVVRLLLLFMQRIGLRVYISYHILEVVKKIL